MIGEAASSSGVPFSIVRRLPPRVLRLLIERGRQRREAEIDRLAHVLGMKLLEASTYVRSVR